MKPTKLVPIFKGGAVHLVDEEIAFMMAAEADKGLPSFEPEEPSGYVSQPSSLRI